MESPVWVSAGEKVNVTVWLTVGLDGVGVTLSRPVLEPVTVTDVLPDTEAPPAVPVALTAKVPPTV